MAAVKGPTTSTSEGGPETINVYEAKTHLSRLLARIEAGEEFIISRAGKPVARLTPLAPVPSQPRRVLGLDHGLLVYDDDDIMAPIPEESWNVFTDDEP